PRTSCSPATPSACSTRSSWPGRRRGTRSRRAPRPTTAASSSTSRSASGSRRSSRARRGAVGLALIALARAAGDARAAPPPSRPLANADAASTRAASSSLRAETVGGLRRLWRFRVPDEVTYAGVLSASPLLIGGRVYVQTLRSNVYALDASDGHVVWRR